MKRSLAKLFVPAATLLLAASAFAGPMAAEKSMAPIAPAPECTWTGFYIGINGGVGWQESTFTNNDFAGYDPYPFGGSSSTTWDNVDYLIGGQLGYNYQWQDLVLGIEADADYSGNSINKTRRYGVESPESWDWQDIATIDFQGSVRARIGLAFNNNKGLIYGTGGVAFVHGDWREQSHYYNQDESNAYDTYWTGEDWRWGLIAGMGMEYKLNCRWSIKAEALYTWLAEDVQGPSFNGSGTVGFYGGNVTFADQFYSARFGLNYNFGSFGLGH